jgi:hypothetical protein
VCLLAANLSAADPKASPRPAANAEKKVPVLEKKLLPFGRPFVAMFAAINENGSFHFIVREPVLNENAELEIADKEFDLAPSDELSIRVEVPPAEVDVTGRVHTYSAAELRKLRGDDKQWGYPATTDALQAGRIVRIILGKPKGAARTVPPQILALHIGKEAGDLKVGQEELTFTEKPGKEDKTVEAKETPTLPKDDDRPPPFGRPFLALVKEVGEDGTLTLTIKERALNGIQVELRDKDVEYKIYEAVHVRTSAPPTDFDNKGAPKKYSAEELKTLKGKSGFWGYPADMDSVVPGRLVKVFLGKHTDDPRNTPSIFMLFVVKPSKPE